MCQFLCFQKLSFVCFSQSWKNRTEAKTDHHDRVFNINNYENKSITFRHFKSVFKIVLWHNFIIVKSLVKCHVFSSFRFDSFFLYSVCCLVWNHLFLSRSSWRQWRVWFLEQTTSFSNQAIIEKLVTIFMNTWAVIGMRWWRRAQFPTNKAYLY